jgi:hypothetical protein
MTCDNTGLYTEEKVRDIFLGDGRIWGVRFLNPINGAVGKLAIKKSLTTAGADAMLILGGTLDTADDNGDIYRIFFAMSDSDSLTLEVGAAHIGIRITPLNGPTQTVLSQTLQIRRTSPASMVGGGS